MSKVKLSIFGLFFCIILSIGILYIHSTYTKSDFDVDLVYLWCDGSEPKFKKQRNYWLKKTGQNIPKNGVVDGRFMQVDELKYSLRSVEQYLPWIHHIYIVTNRQVPKWLNTKHPKITIIDHSQIIPKKYLPVFNSTAIETAIHKIPGLSEYFILANDDTFVNYPLDKDFFFKKGKAILRLKKGNIVKSFYGKILLRALTLMERDFGTISPFSKRDLKPHHNMDAYLKSDYTAYMEHFKKGVENTRKHRFRSTSDIQRYGVSIWSYVKGHAEIKIVSSEQTNKNTPYRWDSSKIVIRNNNYLRTLRFKNPALFCINDDEMGTQKDRQRLKQFLKSYFPWKSEFEL